MGNRLWTGKPDRHVTSHPSQLSLAIPPWVGAMSTSESWRVNGHTARYTSPVFVVSQCKLVSGWRLRKRRSAPPHGPSGSGRTLCFLLWMRGVGRRQPTHSVSIRWPHHWRAGWAVVRFSKKAQQNETNHSVHYYTNTLFINIKINAQVNEADADVLVTELKQCWDFF